MGKKTQDKNINGRKYSVNQFGGRKSLHVFRFLCSCGLPSIVQGWAALQKVEEVEDAGNELTNAVVLFFDRMTADNLDQTIDELFSLAFLDGQPLLPQVDTAFQGDIKTMLEVMKFSMEVNYGTFLGQDMVRRVMETVPKEAAQTD